MALVRVVVRRVSRVPFVHQCLFVFVGEVALRPRRLYRCSAAVAIPSTCNQLAGTAPAPASARLDAVRPLAAVAGAAGAGEGRGHRDTASGVGGHSRLRQCGQ